MEIEENKETNYDQDLDKILLRPTPYNDKFNAGEQLKNVFYEYGRILVVGAGGLGCELLKNLAYSGWKKIDVIDMDTIDLSNLNRQFLFRKKDIGKLKSRVAADFINNRCGKTLGCHVTAHQGKIQDKDDDFYRQFHIIIAGLDNIAARRWLNRKVHALCEFDEETGEVNPGTQRFLIDGGTEGFKGQSRVFKPFSMACYECQNMTTPGRGIAICTAASTPRKPEHCIYYVMVKLWYERDDIDKDAKGKNRKYDTDNYADMLWITEEAQKYGAQHGITDITYFMTLGFVKNIIPAIASTNALIAASCANEALKIFTGCSKTLDNQMMYVGGWSVNGDTQHIERNPECLVCNVKPVNISFNKGDTLQSFIDQLTGETEGDMNFGEYGQGKFSLISTDKPLYMSAMAKMFKDELQMTFGQLIEEGLMGDEMSLVNKAQYGEKAMKFNVTYVEQEKVESQVEEEKQE